MSKNRVFIYGSCVSRDTFEHLDPEQFELVQYVARQSALSAYTRPVTLVEPPRLESPFQQRMVAGDYASSLQTLIPEAAASTDLILVDLVDERLGAHVLPDGSVVTRSTELVQSGAEQQLPAGSQHLPFGSEQHFQYWSQGIGAVGELIRHHMPRAAVVLLDLPWAERSEAGSPTPDSFGVSAAEANPTFRAYAQVAAQALGAEVISLRPEEVASSPDHPWGDAPFHYAEDVYLRVVKQLTGSPGRSVWSMNTRAETASTSGTPPRRISIASEGSITSTQSSPASSSHSTDPRSRNSEVGPNFLIIGAQRAGTTWLEQRLGQHPDVFMAPPSTKPLFARRDLVENAKESELFSRSFAPGSNSRMRGQRSILYFWTSNGESFDSPREDIPQIVSEYMPAGSPMLISLRDPVTRAVSSYWQEVAAGRISVGTSIFSSSTTRGILGIGKYREHYSRWANTIGSDRMKVLLYDDLVADPEMFIKNALDAIGLTTPTDIYSAKQLQAPVNRNTLARSLRSANLPSPGDIRVLVELYREDIEFVESITGRDLSHWTKIDHLLGTMR